MQIPNVQEKVMEAEGRRWKICGYTKKCEIPKFQGARIQKEVKFPTCKV